MYMLLFQALTVRTPLEIVFQKVELTGTPGGSYCRNFVRRSGVSDIMKDLALAPLTGFKLLIIDRLG